MPSPVEQIKSRLDIVDVIQSYIKLQKAGANFKACCPFHNEKTPSFFVTPSREIWHCFGCGKGGDFISFVMEIEGVEFPEALQILASRAGIEIKREDPRVRDERARLFDLLNDATIFYQTELRKNPNAIEYLKERGLKGETVRDFCIGFAPDSWDAALNYLNGKGYSGAEIEKAGLAIRGAGHHPSGSHYDRFRNRVMFPIADASGRAVGFSGRIMPGAKMPDGEEPTLNPASRDGQAKYINSPQTALYDKSRVLYGFDRAKTEIRKENICVLVEGQMDVVMSHQAGIKNCVAVSGTALTPHQLAMINRLADNIVIAFDVDEAGSAAAKRGIDLALEAGIEIKVARISSGKDPADLAKENPDLWAECARNAKHIIEYGTDMLFAKYADDPKALKAEAARTVLPYIARVPNEIEKAHWVGGLATRLKIKEDPIWEEIKKIRRSVAVSPAGGFLPNEGIAARGRSVGKSRKLLLEERLLGLAVWKNQEIKSCFTGVNFDIFSEQVRPVVKIALDVEKESQDEEHKKYINKLAFEAELLYADSEKDFIAETKELLTHLEREHAKERMAVISEDIRRAEISGDAESMQKLIAEFGELSRKLL